MEDALRTALHSFGRLAKLPATLLAVGAIALIAFCGTAGASPYIDAGTSLTCGVDPSLAHARCWGQNDRGQLGVGTAGAAMTSNFFFDGVPVAGLPAGIVAISAGTQHACAISNTSAYCWGANGDGQLGDGTTIDRPSATEVIGLPHPVTAIAAGDRHTCAIAAGAAYCWGENKDGRLGDGTNTSSLMPVQVSGLSSSVQAIDAGEVDSCAVVAGGARCWGYGVAGQLGNGYGSSSNTPVTPTGLASGVSSISTGRSFSCALTISDVKCWGSGLVGNGSTTGSETPVAVNGLPADPTSLTVGARHACALVGGIAYCWGSDADLALGLKTEFYGADPDDRVSATPIESLQSGISEITAGAAETCALRNGGNFCWGLGVDGQGESTNFLYYSPTPKAVSNFASGASLVAAGLLGDCGARQDRIVCWSYNKETWEVPGLSGAITSISSGWGDACAVVDGAVRCGANDDAGGFVWNQAPLAGVSSGVTQVVQGTDGTGGNYYKCAVVVGAAKCWGGNAYGSLGTGDELGKATPTQVIGLTSGVTRMAASGRRTCAVANGALFCWGANGEGAISQPSSYDVNSPVAISGLSSGVTDVAVGQAICAIKSGTLYCWGNNWGGTVGDGTTTARTSPVAITGLPSPVTRVAASFERTCAIAAGALYCWGGSGLGAGGGVTASSSPVLVHGMVDSATEVSVEQSHVCVVFNEQPRCWGEYFGPNRGYWSVYGPSAPEARYSGSFGVAPPPTNGQRPGLNSPIRPAPLKVTPKLSRRGKLVRTGHGYAIKLKVTIGLTSGQLTDPSCQDAVRLESRIAKKISRVEVSLNLKNGVCSAQGKLVIAAKSKPKKLTVRMRYGGNSLVRKFDKTVTLKF